MEQPIRINKVRKGDLSNDISNLDNDVYMAELWQGRIPGQTILEENTSKYFLPVS